MANNKRCIICGSSYNYCPTCSGNKASWKNLFHDENCLKIYGVCVSDRDGKIDRKEAHKKLEECDLSKLDSFESSFVPRIKNIMSYKDTDVSLEIENKEDVVSEDISVTVEVPAKETTVEAETVETDSESSDRKYRRYNKKKNNSVSEFFE